MFELLQHLVRKPDLFEAFDTATLWTDPHVAKVMLELHLDDETALASRPFAQIAAMAEWLSNEVPLEGKALSDLGCGPGLYSEQFQKHGAKVTGIDISATSIDYANGRSIPGAEFIVGSYHDDILPPSDVTTLIYGDICAMPRDKRKSLFARIRSRLSDGGQLILDCFAPSSMKNWQEGLVVEKNLDDGFWAPEPYFGIQQTFLYPAETTVLDKYLILEPSRQRWVYNWLQFLTPEQLSEELELAGFRAGKPRTITTGDVWSGEDDIYCLIASKV